MANKQVSNKEQYFALYARADYVSQDESKALSGNECAIGSRAICRIISDADLPQDDEGARDSLGLIQLQSQRGVSLGCLNRELSTAIIRRIDAGLSVAAVLSAVIFREEDGMFFGEFALICYEPDMQALFERFITSLAARIGKGEHPVVDLPAKDLAQVIQSSGAWCSMKSKPYDKLERGMAYFKKRRGLNDSLVEMAISGKTGCKVGAIIFWIALAIAIGFFIYKLLV